MTFKHAAHLVHRAILVAQGCVCVSSPHFTQQPLTSLAAAISVVLAVFVRFLEKQDADGESKNDDCGTDQIREQVGIRVENGALEPGGEGYGGARENAAKRRADDGATKQRSELGTKSDSGGGVIRTQDTRRKA